MVRTRLPWPILVVTARFLVGTPVLAQSPDEEPSEEVTVYGQPLVAKAREQLIHDLGEQGYSQEIDRGDYILLRNVQPWKGEIRIYDDGWVRMKRQPLRVESRELPWAEQGSALAWASCALYPPMCIKTGGILVGRRKWMAVQGRTLGQVDPEVDVYADRVADSATDQVISSLPARLEALWLRGEPLRPGAPTALTVEERKAAPAALTVEERKAALLDFWNSRTDTPWGDRVREAVEGFLRAEVQTGPYAFTESELDAFNEQRACARVLDLSRAGG
jgi:hypothetical protein